MFITSRYVEENGVYCKKGKKENMQLCTVIPENVLIKRYINLQTGEVIEKIYFEISLVVSGEYKVYSYEILKNRMDRLKEWEEVLSNIIILCDNKRHVVDLFVHVLKYNCIECKTEEILIKTHGWNDNNEFYIGEEEKEIMSEDIKNSIVKLLESDYYVVHTLFLDMCHSMLKKVLYDAGTPHDFISYIQGPSGVGKSKVMECICENNKKNNFISIMNSRQVILKLIRQRKDVTLCLDDAQKTSSVRIREKIDRLLEEIIHTTIDAGKLVIDADNDAFISCERIPHIVISAEEMVTNLSTFNRLYVFEMKEKIGKNIYELMLHIKEKGGFCEFYSCFVSYFKSIKYESWLEFIKKLEKNLTIKSYEIEGLDNRVVQTMKVQYIKKEILMKFISTFVTDEASIEKIEDNFEESIKTVQSTMRQGIQNIKDNDNSKSYIYVLGKILRKVGDVYKITTSEEKYLDKPNKYIGFCVEQDSITFRFELMKILLSANGFRGDPTGIAFTRELTRDNTDVLYIGNDGRASAKYNSASRSYTLYLDCFLTLLDMDVKEKIILLDTVRQKYRKRKKVNKTKKTLEIFMNDYEN